MEPVNLSEYNSQKRIKLSEYEKFGRKGPPDFTKPSSEPSLGSAPIFNIPIMPIPYNKKHGRDSGVKRDWFQLIEQGDFVFVCRKDLEFPNIPGPVGKQMFQFIPMQMVTPTQLNLILYDQCREFCEVFFADRNNLNLQEEISRRFNYTNLRNHNVDSDKITLDAGFMNDNMIRDMKIKRFFGSLFAIANEWVPLGVMIQTPLKQYIPEITKTPKELQPLTIHVVQASEKVTNYWQKRNGELKQGDRLFFEYYIDIVDPGAEDKGTRKYKVGNDLFIRYATTPDRVSLPIPGTRQHKCLYVMQVRAFVSKTDVVPNWHSYAEDLLETSPLPVPMKVMNTFEKNNELVCKKEVAAASGRPSSFQVDSLTAPHDVMQWICPVLDADKFDRIEAFCKKISVGVVTKSLESAVYSEDPVRMDIDTDRLGKRIDLHLNVKEQL